MEAGILGFGIRNSQGFRNPTNDWNPESKFHWQRLESSSWNPASKNVLDFQWGYTINLIERSLRIQLFRERLSEKVHATIPKGFVGGFEFTVLQKKFERLAWEAKDVCLWVLEESNKSRFDSYNLRNSVLIISRITFRDCRLRIFSDNLSGNSCIEERQLNLQASKERRHKVKFPYHQQRSSGSPGRDTVSIRYLQSRIRYAKSDSTTKPTLTKMLLTIPAAVRLLICVISMQ